MILASSPALRLLPRVAAAGALALGLSGCGGVRDMTASIGVAASGVLGPKDAGAPTREQIFIASTRKDKEAPDGALHETLESVSVPPGHKPGEVELPGFGRADPKRHFVMAGSRALDEEEFKNEIASHISGRVGAGRDILLYVHGFNTSLEEARFRLAQIAVDARFAGVPVLFTWPSQKSLFTYEADKDRASASRDALADFMRELSEVPGVGRVHILAHSMGGWLSMEALHENAVAGHPDLDGKLGEVMLAAPDIDLAVFRQQMRPLVGRAHVSVLASRDDRALTLSSKIAGDRPRVGALDPSKPEELAQLRQLGVAVYDVTSFSRDFVGHGVYASAPPVIATIGAQIARPRQGEAPTMAGAATLEPEPPSPPPIESVALPAPQ